MGSSPIGPAEEGSQSIFSEAPFLFQEGAVRHPSAKLFDALYEVKVLAELYRREQNGLGPRRFWAALDRLEQMVSDFRQPGFEAGNPTHAPGQAVETGHPTQQT